MKKTPLVRDYAESTALIAGGTSGIGLETALVLVEHGVRKIAVLGRNKEKGEAARAAIEAHAPGVSAIFLSIDAQDVDQVHEAVAHTHREFGSLDIVVSSISPAIKPDLLFRTPRSELAYQLTSLAEPPIFLTHAAIQIMREQGGGSIINIASDAAKVPTPGESVIGAGMAGIVMFSRVAAIEAKRDGIRVNAVTPSLVEGTPTTEIVLTDGFSRKLFERAAAMAHLGVATPRDLAAMVTFLAGPGAAKVTGQVISVNGGISAG